MYTFDLKKKKTSVLNTDFVTNNNNDNMLSFDGKMLGRSNNSKEDGNKSIIYTVPVKGVKPTRITPIVHSHRPGSSPVTK